MYSLIYVRNLRPSCVLEDGGIAFRLPVRATDLSIVENVQTGPGADTTSSQIGTASFYPGKKAVSFCEWLLVPFNAKFRTVCFYNSSPHHAFTAYTGNTLLLLQTGKARCWHIYLLNKPQIFLHWNLAYTSWVVHSNREMFLDHCELSLTCLLRVIWPVFMSNISIICGVVLSQNWWRLACRQFVYHRSTKRCCTR